MMEVASLLKLTKNAFYRAMLIFIKLSDLESNIILSKKLTHYACACLSLGGKLEYSGSNYTEELVNINSRKISKE